MEDENPSLPVRDGSVPRHVAIIMDGNGRWAAERGLPRYAGHYEGMRSVREAVEGAIDAGLEILTLFAFSTENWARPEDEVLALMALLKVYSEKEREELRQKGVEVHVLGDLTRIDDSTREAVELMKSRTQGGSKLRMNLMVSYSGRSDIIEAARELARRVGRGDLDPEEIDAPAFAETLSTRGLPDPDLLIRTSGEFRISNFMLWELAYAEIHVTPVLWPDFTRDDLFQALREFQLRNRRFGRISFC
ncbi:MAG: di-trans,poly-cis-decaprenylcistransferase [Gemmatimonadetes bacterium]|nr:di-trans,poly-cis-decaprenylcistransferase [Gemmatimonadota bacterium]